MNVMHILNRFKLRTRFLILMSTPIIGLLIILTYSYFLENSVSKNIERVISIESQTQIALSNLYTNGLQAGQGVRNIILDKSETLALENYNKAKSNFFLNLNKIRELQKDNSKLLTTLIDIENRINEYFFLSDEVIELMKDDNNEEESKYRLSNILVPKWRKIKAILYPLIDEQIQLSQISQTNMQEDISSHLFNSYLVGILIISVTIVVGFMGAKTIIKPIFLLKDAALKIADGQTDFELSVDGNDEINDVRETFNRMIYNKKMLNNN